MTNLELLIVGFLSLLLAGTAAFLTASHNADWDARHNALPQYVEISDVAQYSFRGTFGGDL